MKVAYRLCRSLYSASSGDGAKRFGGRWNPPGTSAVYAAENRALCVLERLAHLVQLPRDDAFTRIVIPSETASVALRRTELPHGWDDPVEHGSTQALAAKLLKDVAVLRVPSIVVPDEWCLVLNPEHPDFQQIRFGAPKPFRYDHRLRPGA